MRFESELAGDLLAKDRFDLDKPTVPLEVNPVVARGRALDQACDTLFFAGTAIGVS